MKLCLRSMLVLEINLTYGANQNTDPAELRARFEAETQAEADTQDIEPIF